MHITLLRCQGQTPEFHLVYGLADWPKDRVRHFGLERATVVYTRPALPGEDKHPGLATHSVITGITCWEAVRKLESAHGVNADQLKDGIEANFLPAGQMFLFVGDATFSGYGPIASVV
jgi:hypothetical protein